MNTLCPATVLDLRRLADAHAADLVAEGHTPKHCRAVTADRVAKLEFRNGSVHTVTIPLGRLAKWAALLDRPRSADGHVREPQIAVEFQQDAEGNDIGATFLSGSSRFTLHSQVDDRDDGPLKDEHTLPGFALDAGPDHAGQFALIGAEQRLAEAKAKREAKAAAEKAEKPRRIYLSTLAELRAEAEARRNELAAAARELTEARARLAAMSREEVRAALLATRDARRQLRRALADPETLRPWFDAEQHGHGLAHLARARAELAAYKVPLRFSPFVLRQAKWENLTPKAYAAAHGHKPEPVHGPKWAELRALVTQSEKNLSIFVSRSYWAWCEARGVHGDKRDGPAHAWRAARREIARWPARKPALAAAYVEALAAKRAHETANFVPGVYHCALVERVAAEVTRRTATCAPRPTFAATLPDPAGGEPLTVTDFLPSRAAQRAVALAKAREPIALSEPPAAPEPAPALAVPRSEFDVPAQPVRLLLREHCEPRPEETAAPAPALAVPRSTFDVPASPAVPRSEFAVPAPPAPSAPICILPSAISNPLPPAAPEPPPQLPSPISYLPSSALRVVLTAGRTTKNLIAYAAPGIPEIWLPKTLFTARPEITLAAN
jgi:hypothetical protein